MKLYPKISCGVRRNVTERCQLSSALIAVASVLLVGTCGPLAARGEDEKPIPIAEIKHEGPVDFEKEVLPILRRNCLACHNSTDAESDLVLETPQAILKGGAEGPAAIAGKGAESLLIKLSARQRESYMPPDGNDVGAKQLTPEELGLIKLWIDQGAKGEVSGGGPLVWQPLPPGVNPIYAVAQSDDGRYAAAGRANQIFIYHVPTQRELGRLTDPEILKSGTYDKPGVAHLDLVQSLAFHPQGNLLASGGYRCVKLWQRQEPAALGSLPDASGQATTIALTADGKQAALGMADGSIQLYDVSAGVGTAKSKLTGHSGAVRGAQFSADGSKLVSVSSDKTLRVWDLAQGKQLAAIGAPYELTALALAGKDLQAVTNGEANNLTLWQLPSDEPALAAGDAPFALITASSDGKLLALAQADGKISLLDAAANKVTRTFAGHAGGVKTLSFNPANNRLVSYGADKKLRIWDVANDQATHEVEWDAPLTAVALSSDLKLVVCGLDNGGLKVGQLDKIAEGKFAEDGVTEIGEIKQAITGLVFSANNQTVYASSADGTIRGLQVSDGKQLFSANHGAPVHSLAIHQAKNLLASGGEDKLIKLWNLANGAAHAKPQLEGLQAPVSSVAFSADGAQLVASSGAQVAVFDVTEAAVRQLSTAPEAASAVAAAQDAQGLRMVALAGKSLQSWRPAWVRALAGHAKPVTSLAGVNETQVISGSEDGSLRQWNLANGQAVRTLQHGAPVTAVAVRGDTQRVASAGGGVAKLWDASGKQLTELAGDYRIKLSEAATTQSIELAKQRVTLAQADLKAAEDRKKSEEENGKKAVEAETKADEELKKKIEAAKKPTADKEAADKALEEAKVAVPKAEEAKKVAEQDAVKADEALKKAQADQKTATDAATAAAKAATDAAAKVKEAQAAADKDKENKDLAEALTAAQKAAEEAEAKKKEADEAKVKADKVVADATEAKKKADADKAQTAKDLTTAQAALKTAEANVTKAEAPYKKAMDEQTAAQRALDAAKRSVTRSMESIKKATDALPPLKQAIEDETAAQKAKEAELEKIKKEFTDSQKPVQAVAFSPDGKLVVTTNEVGQVKTWSAEDGAAIDLFEQGEATSLVALLDADRLVVGTAKGTSVVSLNPPWKLLRTIGSPASSSHFVDRVTALNFSPDGQLLVTGGGEPSRSGELKVWNVETGELVREIEEPHSDTIFALEFSRDGKQLASCGADRFVKVFTVADGKFVRSFEGHTHHVLGVSWNATGRELASSGADMVIKVWDAQTGDQKRTISGFSKEVTAIRFMGITNNVVASCGDSNVHVKRTDNGGNVRSLTGGTDFMYAVAISSDGKQVVSGGQDSVLRVWDDAGKVVATFEPPQVAEQTAKKE